MRRHKAKPALIIFGVVIFFILAYVDLKGKFFLDNFRNKAPVLIKDSIGLDCEVGDIEGGIFRGIVLKDVKLYLKTSLPEEEKALSVGVKEGRRLLASFSAINFEYRLWDIALCKLNKLDKMTFTSPKFFLLPREDEFFVSEAAGFVKNKVLIFIRDGVVYDSTGKLLMSELNGGLNIDRNAAELNCISANVLGRKFNGCGKVGFPVGDSVISIEGALKGSGYALKARLEGAGGNIAAKGSFSVEDNLGVDFAGNIITNKGVVELRDFKLGNNFILNGLFYTEKKTFNFDLRSENEKGNVEALGQISRIGVSADCSKLPYFTMDVKIDHLRLLGFDVLSNYSINGKLNYDNDGKFDSLVGDFSTSGSIVNYAPIRELRGTYEFKDGKARLNGVNYGDVMLLNALFSFTPPEEIDLNVKFKGTQLGGLTDLTLDKGAVSGLVYGDINICEKSRAGLKIDGQLNFYNGNISAVKYNSAKVNFKAEGLTLEFTNSKVYTESGVLNLEGKMDLRDIGTPRIFRDIAIKSDLSAVIWSGVNMIKRIEEEEVITGKDINEQFRINFKMYDSQRTQGKSPKQDEMEFEYKLGKPGSVKLKMKENEDFFGLERKVEF
ncbi:MAG: hypothetical protein V1933_02690 [Candidatus Omnitrophota bacterium]